MSLTLSIRKGESFRVNDTQCTVTDILGPHHFTLTVNEVPGHLGPVMYKIDHKVAQEVLPQVTVCSSNRDEQDREGTLVSVCIDAPRHITVLRERLYQKAQRKKATRGT